MKTKEYKHPWMVTLSRILYRCNNKNHRYYKEGIKNFLTLEDVKYLWFRDKAYKLEKPSIDRRDSGKHYTLKNCRFVEHRVNSGRKRTNKINFAIAQEIRKQVVKGVKSRKLAQKYNITQSFVGKVKLNKWYRI